jgi:hypothetical protein
MSGEEFIAALLTEFPELTDEVREDEGLLHVQMGAFARHTEAAIARGDLASVDRCFALAHRAFHDADAPLKNALYVSYLEHLDFGGPHGEAARSRMSALLRHGYTEIMDYLDMLARTSKRPRT